jgi:hypothetical protein
MGCILELGIAIGQDGMRILAENKDKIVESYVSRTIQGGLDCQLRAEP